MRLFHQIDTTLMPKQVDDETYAIYLTVDHSISVRHRLKLSITEIIKLRTLCDSIISNHKYPEESR